MYSLIENDNMKGSVVCCDYEEILVQERIQMLDVGTMPRSITVILLHDLVDCCKVNIVLN